ncbi:MAG TPA: hypothetical protein VI815_02645 [Candidatus Nanoarchaeia archaeon]|nr:hypothetical protein [Candidatus Nanoarchaeia archaeon]
MDLKTIGLVFDDLSKISSTNAKKDLINLYKNDEDLKLIFRFAYDPYIKFYVAKVVLISEINACKLLYTVDDLMDQLQPLHDRVITGNQAREHVENIYTGLPFEFRPYLEKILKKDLKIGVGIGLINDIWPDWIPEFKLGLCERFKKVKPKFPLLIEPKIDGVRALIFINPDGNIEIKARSGIPYTNFKVIEQETRTLWESFYDREKEFYKNGVVLDGEIQDKTFNGIMNNARRIHDVQCDEAVFKLWDILPLEEFLEEKCTHKLKDRKNRLNEFLFDDGEPLMAPHLVTLPYGEVNSMDDVIKSFEYWKGEVGEEGVICKDSNSMYMYSAGSKRGGKQATWWKFKIQDYDEVMGNTNESEYIVKILDAYLGEKGTKNEDRLGGFTYEAEIPLVDEDIAIEEKTVKISGKCGGGFEDKERNDFWKRKDELIGQFIEVVSQEITINKQGTHSLRFPIFKRFRPDCIKTGRG